MSDLYVDFNILRQNEEVDNPGTCYQAKITASYHQLVDTFGYPENMNEKWNGLTDNKVEVEWTLDYGDDIIATIYNWKNGKAYDPDNGKNVEDIMEWHIGGVDAKAIQPVINSINAKLMWNLRNLMKEVK